MNGSLNLGDIPPHVPDLKSEQSNGAESHDYDEEQDQCHGAGGPRWGGVDRVTGAAIDPSAGLSGGLLRVGRI